MNFFSPGRTRRERTHRARHSAVTLMAAASRAASGRPIRGANDRTRVQVNRGPACYNRREGPWQGFAEGSFSTGGIPEDPDRFQRRIHSMRCRRSPRALTSGRRQRRAFVQFAAAVCCISLLIPHPVVSGEPQTALERMNEVAEDQLRAALGAYESLFRDIARFSSCRVAELNAYLARLLGLKEILSTPNRSAWAQQLAG